MRRWVALVAFASAALLLQGAAAGCEDCDRWYEPSIDFEPSWSDFEPSYELPVFEEPAYEPPAFDGPAYDPPAYEPPVRDQPAYEPAIYEPPAIAEIDAGSSYQPGFRDEPVLSISAPIAAAPDQASRANELGLHTVTDVFVGNQVISDGLTTRYISTTERASPNTAAALVGHVGTGEASALDGALSNGRMVMADGRSVAGDIYRNYVWNGYDWVFDKYVFFQDDLSVARIPTPSSPPAPPATQPLVVVPASTIVVAPAAPAGPAVTPEAPTSAFVAPRIEGSDRSATPPSSSAPAQGGVGRAPDVRAGVALGQQADVLGSIEVLRGLRVALWLRGTVDGAPARVLSWQLSSGEVIALGPLAGAGDEPFVATWRAVAPRGSAFDLRFDTTVEVPGEAPRRVAAAIAVIVRSPALVQ